MAVLSWGFALRICQSFDFKLYIAPQAAWDAVKDDLTSMLAGRVARKWLEVSCCPDMLDREDWTDLHHI